AETGEYIELYNAGTAAADPRAIEIKLLDSTMNIAVDVRPDSPEELVVLDEIVPGLPASFTTQPRPLLLVLKNGGVGGPDVLNTAIAHLWRER
ncbi:MAG: hypothetical protein ACK46X_14180, partial [Candidatus Sericytochromatia bacterium]